MEVNALHEETDSTAVEALTATKESSSQPMISEEEKGRDSLVTSTFLTSSSLQPIFTASGPRLRVVKPRAALDALSALEEELEPDVYILLKEAWERVFVPCDTYWCERSVHVPSFRDNEEGPVVGQKRDRGEDDVDEMEGGVNLAEADASVRKILRDIQQWSTARSETAEAIVPSPAWAALTGITCREVDTGALFRENEPRMDGTTQRKLRCSLFRRYPNPHCLLDSFYPTRSSAMKSCEYVSGNTQVVIALDKPIKPSQRTTITEEEHTGKKVFTVMPTRSEEGSDGRIEEALLSLALKEEVTGEEKDSGLDIHFETLNLSDASLSQPLSPIPQLVKAIPTFSSRNLYVLVDEASPVDPFVDVDFSLPYRGRAPSSSKEREEPHAASNNESCGRPSSPLDPYLAAGSSIHQAVELALQDVLLYLVRMFKTILGVEVRYLVVLTSSYVMRAAAPISEGSSSHASALVSSEKEGQEDGNTSGDAPSSSLLLDQMLEGKISFHIHFRLSNHCALESIQALRRLMHQIQATAARDAAALYTASSEGEGGEEASKRKAHNRTRVVASAVLAFVDFSVYTRWRPFRLPYNVKATERDVMNAELHGRAVEEEEVIREKNDACSRELLLPSVEVGAIASEVLQDIVWRPSDEQASSPTSFSDSDPSIPERLSSTSRLALEAQKHRSRFLLPLVPPITRLRIPSLAALLTRYSPFCRTESFLFNKFPAAIATLTRTRTVESAEDLRQFLSNGSVHILFNMAFIQRQQDPSLSYLSSYHGGVLNGFPQLQRLTVEAETAVREADGSVNEALPPRVNSSLSYPKPFPPSVLVPIHELRVKRLVAEVYHCLHPAFGGSWSIENEKTSLDRQSSATSLQALMQCAPRPLRAIGPEKLQIQFDKGGIRSYHVKQKENKFCMHQQRLHRSTYSQLYLTYGSVKVRCYSNDCYQKHFVVPWVRPATDSKDSAFSPGMESVEGYPKYERLEELRGLLFPELAPQVSLERYGGEALKTTDSEVH